MHRRAFLLSACSLAAPTLALGYPSQPYAPATWPNIRDGNDRIVLNFRANWSLTCQLKREILTELLPQNPNYAQLTFVDVDWDTFGRSVWVQQRLKVKRRSTLIAFQGKQELARIENEPYAVAMRKFLDAAISG